MKTNDPTSGRLGDTISGAVILCALAVILWLGWQARLLMAPSYRSSMLDGAAVVMLGIQICVSLAAWNARQPPTNPDVKAVGSRSYRNRVLEGVAKTSAAEGTNAVMGPALTAMLTLADLAHRALGHSGASELGFLVGAGVAALGQVALAAIAGGVEAAVRIGSGFAKRGRREEASIVS